MPLRRGKGFGGSHKATYHDDLAALRSHLNERNQPFSVPSIASLLRHEFPL